MKIGIITQPLRYNYGGILQNYALQTILKEMGHEPVTLDPNPYVQTNWATPFRIIKRAIWKYILRKQQGDVFWEYKRNHYTRLLRTNIGKFIKDKIQTIEYYKTKDLSISEYDAFIVGSDQVWRPIYNSSYGRTIYNCFLDFVGDRQVKRIAYAASYGTDINEYSEEQIAKCRVLLDRFDFVSVREEGGIHLCKELFDLEAVQVLDPTLLLTKDDYITLVSHSSCKLKEKEGNLYVYMLDDTTESNELVLGLAKKMSMRPFSYNSKVNDWKHSSKYSIKDKIQPPVELWLKGFEQAECVITDSFHACVFSIIFKKQFYVYGNRERGMDRYRSLFAMLGIESRFISNMDDVSNMERINYDSVYCKLEKLRSFSLNYLAKSLSSQR
jgi:hypothetical protein